MKLSRTILLSCLVAILPISACAQKVIKADSPVSTEQFSKDVTQFLGREIAAHIDDINSLDPPQERVVGALTIGEFSWGTFLRAVASYSALSGDRKIADRDLAKFIGQMGLIESKHGGKTFAQLYAALALRSFGTDLKTNPIWLSLSPEEQEAWRSLLDPARFYDRKTRHVINLPENYFGVAARVVSMDYQLGIIKDRVFVDDVLNRAAEQFTKGGLYSDDSVPTGRFDRYSNEYARYIYESAENVGRQDLMKAMEPSLNAQMRTWWDLISPDGYGYPWGRSLGIISYIDTIEIVGFLAKHPQFRPAPLPQLATAYYSAWKWLENDYQKDRHLLNVFGFGRGNYNYINPQREWQQTTAFFGKVSGAHKQFIDGLLAEHVSEFPAKLELREVARFEFFRKGDRPSGVWLVRQKGIRFALPITTGPRPGVSDYLPAPYGLAGFAPPVEQVLPNMTPYLELSDGTTVVAGDSADEIYPAEDGRSLRAVWTKWVVLGGKAGQTVDPGLKTEVTWKFDGNSLMRSESISTNKQIAIKNFWFVVPTTANFSTRSTRNGIPAYKLQGQDGALEVTALESSFPLDDSLQATGNGDFGKGSRGPVPLIINFRSSDLVLNENQSINWKLLLSSTAAGK
jgi:hypothetical protein